MRPSPPPRWPSSRRPDPRRAEAPTAAATAAQIENFSEKFFKKIRICGRNVLDITISIFKKSLKISMLNGHVHLKPCFCPFLHHLSCLPKLIPKLFELRSQFKKFRDEFWKATKVMKKWAKARLKMYVAIEHAYF